ncbi:hypothetical protein CRENBAI_011874 [Crenichthys baileyi]|uniref:Uncharacterized protein n=1 Tax=Crenichthys baileyi TaxID=28760 RepID=A0AAV9SE10_9TELE
MWSSLWQAECGVTEGGRLINTDEWKHSAEAWSCQHLGRSDVSASGYFTKSFVSAVFSVITFAWVFAF